MVLDNNIRFTATEVVSRVAVGDRKSPVIEVKTRQSQQLSVADCCDSSTGGTLIFFVKVQVSLSLQIFSHSYDFSSQWGCCDIYLLVCHWGSD